MEEQRILEAIESLRQDLGGRLDSIEQRLDGTERRLKDSEQQQDRQQRDIDALFKRLDALCRDKPIWRSYDQREVAVRKEDAYKLFEELGFTHREALRAIDRAGKLSRNQCDHRDRHLVKKVRAPRLGPVRAVVVFVEGE